MDNLTRRGFLKLGLITTGTLTVGPRVLRAMELKLGGEDYIYLRVEERKPVPFSCINCESRDGALAYLNTETNRIVKIEGNPIDVSSRGRCCPKGSAGHLQAYDPDRILYPLKRVGERGEGKWRRVTWDDALNEVAGKVSGLLDKGNRSEIFFHMGKDTTGGALSRFMDTLGAPNLIKTGYAGDINKKLAMKATWGAGAETPDFTHSKYILMFGSSIYETSPTRAQRITEGIIENRAKMVVFDVRASNTAGKADEWFPLFPGTDGLVALAMANVIIEEGLADKRFVDTWTNYSYSKLAKHLEPYTPEMAEEQSGVHAKDIRRIAIEFATNGPATIFTYRGTSSHFYGTYHERACMLLPIITGNIEVKGGYCLPRVMTYPQPQPIPPKLGGKSLSSLSSKYPLSRDKATPLLPFLIKDGKEKASILFNYMSNPAYSSSAASVWHDVLQDEKLIPLIVDFSPFMSETAALADLILPEASFLERYDPENSSTTLWPSVGIRQPVVKPLGDSRETRMVLQDIVHKVDPEGKRGMKKYWDFKDSEEWMKRHFNQIPALKKDGGVDFLKKKGVWPVYGKLDSKTRKIVDKTGEPIKADYGLYKKEVTPSEMRGATVNKKTRVISKGGETIGVRIGGKNYRGFNTPSGKIEIYVKDFEKYGFDPLPVWKQVPWHKGLRKEELVLVTFKRSVHNMSLTPNTKWLAEVAHSNPVWINHKTAKELGIEDGDLVRITSPVGYMVTKARVTESIHPQAVAVPSSAGHKALGRVATAHPHAEGHEGSEGHDRDIEHNLWWRDKGVSPNDIIPVYPDPVSGVQTWSDTVVSVSPALREDKYGEINVHNGKHFEHYSEILKYAYNDEYGKKAAKAS